MKLEQNNGALTLKLTNRLDAITAPMVIDSVKDQTFSRLEIQLEELTYISSAGLRALLICKKTADACGGSLVLVKPQKAVLDIIQVSGLAKVLEIQE